MADVDYDSEEEEMLARSEELRALEEDDGGGDIHDDDGEYSQSQGGSQYSKGGSSFRSGDYSRSEGGSSYRSGQRNDYPDDDESDDVEEEGDDDDYDSEEYSHDDDHSGHDERSHRSRASAYSHHSQASNYSRRSEASKYSHDSRASDYSHRSRDSAASGSRSSANESKKSKTKKKKSKSSKSSKPKKFDPFEPVDPDRLSAHITKEEEEQMLAYQTPPVPLQFSGRYLRGPFGTGNIRNVLLGGGGGSGGRDGGGVVKVSRKERDGMIREGARELNLGPLIVYDDGGGKAGEDRTPGSLIYGCRGPSPSSSAPPSVTSDPLGLHTDAAIDKPIVTAADLLRWLTALVHYHSVRRILCLLDEAELQAIAPPAGYRQMLESYRGVQRVTLCDLSQPGARDVALGAIEEAVRAGERIAVHCGGGEHHTGTVLALWLCRYGEGGMSGEVNAAVDADGAVEWRMRPEEAVARVVAEATRAGVVRHPDLEQVRALVKEGCRQRRRDDAEAVDGDEVSTEVAEEAGAYGYR